MKRAFTLIELLIVVAIIAILAAIAVPNFLEAQVRAKISRARADQQTLGTALHAYRVDQGRFPVNNGAGWVQPMIDRMRRLTTPVSYLNSLPTDPFRYNTHDDALGGTPQYLFYTYFSVDVYNTGWRSTGNPPDVRFLNKVFGGGDGFILVCVGPDRSNVQPWNGRAGDGTTLELLQYDPTNGTVSLGNIQRTQFGTEPAGCIF